MRLSCLAFAALLVPAALGQPARPAAPAPPQQPSSQIQSPSYDDLVAKALSLLAGKNAQESVAVSEQAIAMNEKRWEAYATAASAYSAQQLYDDTISMLQMALGRAPEAKKQAVRDAITAARRQLAAEVASKPAESTGIRSEPVPAQPTTLQAEAALWKAIENSTRAEDYQGYLDAYPNGTFAPVARRRLDAISKKASQEVTGKPRTFHVFHMHSTSGVAGSLTVDPVNVTYKEETGEPLGSPPGAIIGAVGKGGSIGRKATPLRSESPSEGHNFTRGCSVVRITNEEPKSFTISAPGLDGLFVKFFQNTFTADFPEFRFADEQTKSDAVSALIACGASK